MKINTIGTCTLVYLFTRIIWNALVSVKADNEGQTVSGGADSVMPDGQKGNEGLAATTPTGGNSGVTAGESLVGGVNANSADGVHSSGSVLVNGSLYPSDLMGSYGGHLEVKDPYYESKERTTKLIKENLKKILAELSQTIDVTDDVDELSAKMDAKVYSLTVGLSELQEVAKPPDMMYYSGFPDGWHYGDPLLLQKMYYEDRKRELKAESEAVKADIDAKKGEIGEIQKALEELAKKLKNLQEEHKKLQEKHQKLEEEHKKFQEEQGELAKKSAVPTVPGSEGYVANPTAGGSTGKHIVSPVYEAHLPASSTTLVGDSSATPEIKLYKDDSNGNPVEMVEGIDFDAEPVNGDNKYTFKANVKCTLIKIGDKEIWKKGDQGVDETDIAAYSPSLEIIAIRDADKYFLYKKDNSSNQWKHHDTVDRKKPANGAETTNSSSTSATTPPVATLTRVDTGMTATTPSSGNSGLTGSAPSTPGTGPTSRSCTGTGGGGGTHTSVNYA